MKLNQSNLWFGTEASFDAYTLAMDSVASLIAQGESAVKMKVLEMKGGSSSDPFAMPPLVSVKDGVATLDIAGSLVNGYAGFGRLFGVIGYADIQEALLEAAASKDAKSVFLNIDSGGGQVAGVQDTGNLIRQVAQIKPVAAYTDGTMASAAYWLGASADKVYGSNLSQSGSVGTLIVHMEMSKALEQSGRKVTMVRYGDYKALSNPYEPLSAKGLEQLQSLADASGKIFVAYAAERRGTTAAKFQATMGEGRVFMGQDAMNVGLIDGVLSFGEAMTITKSLDKQITGAHNSSNSQRNSSMKAALSKKTLLAIAAGVALDALGLNTAEANTAGTVPEGEALTALTAEATEVSAAFGAAISAAVAQVTADHTTIATDLTAKVAALELAATAAASKVTLAEAAATNLASQLAASAQIAGEQAGIVKSSISVMSVALGGTADVGATLVGAELLAEHTRLKEQFTKKFPKGGVAAVNVDLNGEGAKKMPPPAAFMALLPKTAK